MKAAVLREHGGLEAVEVGEMPEPLAGPGEVVVEVRAAALNHLDIWVRRGGRVQLPMPHVLGSDAAGVVAELGPGVTGVEVGDAVLVNPWLCCGVCEFCLRGEQSECIDPGIIGMARPGVFAERVVVPAANLVPKPPAMSFEHAACLGIAYTTAWRMLMTRARLRPGETVLIHGIGGGVAQAGLLLARHAGAEVLVTSSSDAKLARARAMGAHAGINYSKADVAQRVAQLTDGRGVDIAFDAVGAATWPLDFQVVRRGGRIVLCGITTGAQAPTDLQALYWNQLAVFGSTMGSAEDLRLMVRTVVLAGIEPVIDSVLPLAQAREAMARMEAGQQFGKILLTTA